MAAPEPPDQRVTELLDAAASGDGLAATQLLPLVYDELRRAARRLLGRKDAGTVQPTALVHDAYVRLARHEGPWEGRRHFLCVAAKAMRQILSDRARDLRAQKRGGDWRRITLDEQSVADGGAGQAVDLLALDEALSELAAADPRCAAVVEMRYFAGMTIEEVAASLEVSATTVKDDWRAARAWLQRRLATGGD